MACTAAPVDSHKHISHADRLPNSMLAAGCASTRPMQPDSLQNLVPTQLQQQQQPLLSELMPSLFNMQVSAMAASPDKVSQGHQWQVSPVLLSTHLQSLNHTHGGAAHTPLHACM